MTGADDPDLSVALTRSTATLSSPDLLCIIRGNGYFSKAVGDTSFLLWPIAQVSTLFQRLYKFWDTLWLFPLVNLWELVQLSIGNMFVNIEFAKFV